MPTTSPVTMLSHTNGPSLLYMYYGPEGLVDQCLTVLAFPGSIGFPSLMSRAVWLTMEVMTRFMLIWLEKS